MSTHKREKAIKQVGKNKGVSVAEAQKEIEITIGITMVNPDSKLQGLYKYAKFI